MLLLCHTILPWLSFLSCAVDLYPEDSVGSVRKSSRDDQQLRAPSHPPHVSPVCQPAAQRGEGRPGRGLGFRPQRHHLHYHSPYQQQVGAPKQHPQGKYIGTVTHILLTLTTNLTLILNPAYISLIIRPVQCDEVSNRSLSLCCDLLTSVCRAALQFCDDALDCHLQVIIGTLTAQVTSRPAISQQVRNKGVNSRLICETSHATSKTQQETCLLIDLRFFGFFFFLL